jgi:E3 ubiquitin-protein ligase TRIP12
MAAKSKPGVAGPSNQSPDDDVEMIDALVESAGEEDAVPESAEQKEKPEGEDHNPSDDDEDEPMTDPPPPPDSSSSAAAPPPPSMSGVAAAAGLGGLDEGTAAALFGNDYRAIGSYMLTLSSRLKTLLENIKLKSDPTTRLIALQELSELLSISTEDTLSGYFQIDAFVKELVKIMGGTGNTEDDDGDDDGEGNENNEAQDEDAALAAALAISTGGMLGADDVEAQVLACRCLANLMEALPGCAHTVVYHGAVPVLCSKLLEIQYIDLAEQTLSVSGKNMLSST